MPPRRSRPSAPSGCSPLCSTRRLLGLGSFVVGPPPVGDLQGDDRVAELSVAFASVAAARDVRFVSVIEPLRSSPVWRGQADVGDGVHPAAGGYQELARLVLAGGFVDWLR